MATRYEYMTTEDYEAGADVGDIWLAQTFTPATSHSIASIKLKGYKTGSITLVTVAVRATTAGVPSGSDLASGTLSSGSIPDSSALFEVVLSSPLALTSGVTYAIIKSHTGTGSISLRSDHIGVADYSDNYTGGKPYWSGDSGSTWTTYHNETYGGDLVFEEWDSAFIPRIFII